MMKMHIRKVFFGACSCLMFVASVHAAQEHYYSPPVHVGGTTWQGLESSYLVHKMIDHGFSRTVFYTLKGKKFTPNGYKPIEPQKGYMTANCTRATLNGRSVNPNGSTVDMQDAVMWRNICNLR